MDDTEVRKAVIQMAAERAREKLAPSGIPSEEEVDEAARWAITELFVRHLRPEFNLDPLAYEGVVNEVAQRLRAEVT